MDNVGIYLFNNVELLDFAGPYEAFSCASYRDGKKPFNVFTISSDGKEVRSVNGLRVNPDYSFKDHPAIDILIIPDGMGTRKEVHNPTVLEWVKKTYDASKITMTVCSGALLPAKLGLLDSLESTTHHGVISYLEEIAPKSTVTPSVRFTDNGKIMTSGGVSAGIDLSLHVIRKRCGDDVANDAMIYLEYGDWKSLM